MEEPHGTGTAGDGSLGVTFDSVRMFRSAPDFAFNVTLMTMPVHISDEGIKKFIAEVVEEKDKHIGDLGNDIGNISEAYNNMLATYMAKLNEYSFPVDDLGFKPVTLRTNQSWEMEQGMDEVGDMM